MFAVKKLFLLLEILYCEQNEIASKWFIKMSHQFTVDKYDIAVKWLTKKVKSFFPLKGRNLHSPWKIYKGVCSCRETYIGETIRNVEECWSEHNLLIINQNQLNILLIMMKTPFCGVFYLLLQKMVEHIKT